MKTNLENIQERRYNLYYIPEVELDELLYKTYTRRDSFAMVIKDYFGATEYDWN